jgi:hypothetical protein
MIRPKMSSEYDWKIVVTGLIVDSTDNEEEAYGMYNEYKAACGDSRICLSFKGTIVRESIPSQGSHEAGRNNST